MFRQLPIVALPDTFYRGCMPRARELIAVRDPEDVDILALALRLQVPLWTDDKDFDSVPDIPILSTQQVLSLLSS